MFGVNNAYYNELDDRIIQQNINGLVVAIDPTWNRIGVNLSGGADSALLTVLLCKIIEQYSLDTKIDIITYQRCWETRPWQGFISLQVYNKIKSMYPNIIHNRYTTYIPPELEHGVAGPIINGRSGDQIIVGSYNKFAAWEYNLDAVFNATSKNPDNLRDDRMTNRDKDAQDGSLYDLWIYSNKVKAVFAHPFKFVKKDWIVAQYELYNLLDLYYNTRSCEGDIAHDKAIHDVYTHFKDYKAGMVVPLCNECWWCEERAWAERNAKHVIKEINEL